MSTAADVGRSAGWSSDADRSDTGKVVWFEIDRHETSMKATP